MRNYIDSTRTYNIFSVSWYVPCSVQYPRWSSTFRILSAELWIILIISIEIATISTTLVGRYSCTSELQGYKTLRSSFSNILAVILGVSMSTMPHTPSLRSLFLACVCFSVAFSTVIQAFLTTFLIDSGCKDQFKTWMICSPQVLNLHTHQITISFWRLVTKVKYENYKEILSKTQWMPIMFVWDGEYSTKVHQFLYPIFILN